MNSRRLRRLGVGATLTIVGGLCTGPLDAPAHAATATSWTDLINQVNTAAGALTVDLLTDVAQPAGSADLTVAPGASITLDLHHHVLTATAQGAGHAGIGLPLTARLIVEDSGTAGAPGSLFATGASGIAATGQGAGAGIGGVGAGGTGGAGGTLIVLAGNVIATGGAATPTSLAGAGAGVGGGGAGGTGTAAGAIGGQSATVRVNAGSLTAHGGNAAGGGGSGAGVGGGGGSAGGTFAGGAGGTRDGAHGIGNVHVTGTGLLIGAGGTANSGGAGAGIGGGGGGSGTPGGAGGAASFVGLAPSGEIRGTGGTSTTGGGGAGIGGGGGAAAGGSGGSGATISKSVGASVTDSGPGAAASGGGGLDSAQFNGGVATWHLSLYDSVGGRAHDGSSYTYVVNARQDNATGLADTLTLTLSLPPGVVAAGATADEWTCSTGTRVVTCAWTGPNVVPAGLLMPISVPVTFAPGTPVASVLTATATISGSESTSASGNDTVTTTRRHHRH